MNLKQRIDADLKSALLAGDKVLATTLRGLKSVILYAEVAKGNREDGLPEVEIIELLMKEAKKRQESADLYLQGSDETRQQAELAEKKVIETYLPAQVSDEELMQVVQSAIAEVGATDMQQMGQVIAKVKQQLQAGADGARIAAVVKEKLGQ